MTFRKRIVSVFLGLCIGTANANVPADSSAGYKINRLPVSEALEFERRSIKVFDSQMSYLELGDGEPVLFVHGNPTSAYLWRNILPKAAKTNRAIAVDLIGMGRSKKPDIDYTFADHYRYFSEFVKQKKLKNITLVGHDWGAALAWEYARNNPGQVKRLAFMEGVLPPNFPFASFEAMGPDMGNMFMAFKDPVQGKKMVIDDNMFVEQLLPGFVNRPLGELAMTEYRAPYLTKASRKPLLVWPLQVPIGGEPKDTEQVMKDIETFMGKTKMPVLLLYASPGVILPPAAVPWYVKQITNIETSYVGVGLHFIQEDQPESISLALADWIRRH